jgi:hypothetical protein
VKHNRPQLSLFEELPAERAAAWSSRVAGSRWYLVCLSHVFSLLRLRLGAHDTTVVYGRWQGCNCIRLLPRCWHLCERCSQQCIDNECLASAPFYDLPAEHAALAASTRWVDSKGRICLLCYAFGWGPMTLGWCLLVDGSGIMDCPDLYACVSITAHNSGLKTSIIWCLIVTHMSPYVTGIKSIWPQ